MKSAVILVALLGAFVGQAAADATCTCFCTDGSNPTYDLTDCDNGCYCSAYCTRSTGYQCVAYRSATWVAYMFISFAVVASIFVAIIYNRRKSLGLSHDGCTLFGHWVGCFCLGIFWLCIYCCMESNDRQRQGVYAQPYAAVAVPVGAPGTYAQMPGQPYYQSGPVPGQPYGSGPMVVGQQQQQPTGSTA